MPIRSNGYYNDPAFAQAAANLSQLFAPPSGADAAGWAAANAKNAEARRLADFFETSKDQSVAREVLDRMGVGAGVYAPSQSYYSVDQGNITTQRGQDITAATSRANNAADNERALEDRRMQEVGALQRLYAAPVSVNKDQTVYLPEQTAAATGLGGTLTGMYSVNPGEMLALPNGQTVQGAPKPRTEAEVKGGILEDAYRNPSLTNDIITEAIYGDKTPVQAAGPDGTAVFMAPGEAARTNAQAYVNKGAEAKGTNGVAQLPNGTRVTAYQRPGDSVWRNAQTGEVLPDSAQVFDMPRPQGSAEDVGLSKPVTSNIQKQLVDINVAKDTAVQLRDLIQKSPASQGIVGWLRGTAQNVMQAGGEVGQYFGGNVADIQKRIADGLEDASLGGAFDPNIPAIEMMANLLAFQYAKTTTGERLSNEMLKASRQALGLEGLTGNQASSIARLNQAIKSIERQEGILRGALNSGGVPSVPAPPEPPSPPTPPSSGATRLRFNPETGDFE
ncbi:MAG: hypothetical protein ACTHLK_22620 [Brucella intermedia]